MKIGMLGDIALIGNYDISKHSDVKEKLQYLKSELDKCDYRIANLEAPFTTKIHTKICKSMHLKSAKENIETLKYLKIDAVSLANNHIYDYGRKAVEETMELLAENGIGYFGVDGRYLELELEGQRFHLSGFCCYSTNGAVYLEKGMSKGVNLLCKENIEKQIAVDERQGAFSIFNIHYGLEHIAYPAHEHMYLFEWMMQQKKMIIQGHHSHSIQGIKKLGDSIVFYSLGNGIFDRSTSINGGLTVEMKEYNKREMLVFVDIEDGKIKKYETKGLYNEPEKGISPINIEDYVNRISNDICNIVNISEYEKKRAKDFQAVVQEKFGKKNIAWIMARMNYYAIGAKIKTKIFAGKYRKEIEKFTREY